jgi:hypothetical protein
MVASEASPHLFLVPLVINFIVFVAVIYCNLVGLHRLPVWTAGVAALLLFGLAGAMGFYSAYYARVLDPRRYDIVLEGERLSTVRLIRASSIGLLYAGEDTRVSFVNLAKVVMVLPATK